MARPRAPVILVLTLEGYRPRYAVQAAEVIGEDPRQVAGAADIPESEDTANLSRVLGQLSQNARRQHLERGWHNGLEQAVNRLVVNVLGTVEIRDNVE